MYYLIVFNIKLIKFIESVINRFMSPSKLHSSLKIHVYNLLKHAIHHLHCLIKLQANPAGRIYLFFIFQFIHGPISLHCDAVLEVSLKQLFLVLCYVLLVYNQLLLNGQLVICIFL